MIKKIKSFFKKEEKVIPQVKQEEQAKSVSKKAAKKTASKKSGRPSKKLV